MREGAGGRGWFSPSFGGRACVLLWGVVFEVGGGVTVLGRRRGGRRLLLLGTLGDIGGGNVEGGRGGGGWDGMG